MNNPTYYSRGCYAEVFRTTTKQRQNFPGADLVRVEKNLCRYLAEAKYLELKMAHTVSPQNFIEPVGYSTENPHKIFHGLLETLNPLVNYLRNSTHSLYSKEAPVPAEHATFSAHLVSSPVSGIKQRCDCRE